MVTVRYGGKGGRAVRLVQSDQHLVVRTWSRCAVRLAPLSRTAREVLAGFQLVARFRRAGVEVFRAAAVRGARTLRDRARVVLRREPALRFAGRVLVDPVGAEPVVYTENLFVKLRADLSAGACRRLLRRHGLAVKRRLDYAANAYFVAAPEGTGQAVFLLAGRLLTIPEVELCHPELVREMRRRAVFPGQWHL
jgi:hypothetical protein